MAGVGACPGKDSLKHFCASSEEHEFEQWTWVWAKLDGCKFEQAPGVGDGQGSLACCSPWGHKESDLTEWLNWLMCLQQSIQVFPYFSKRSEAAAEEKTCSPAQSPGSLTGDYSHHHCSSDKGIDSLEETA